ncbi:hypothetical protein SVIOM342S_00444 [Streptomyces violaceorubidus]
MSKHTLSVLVENTPGVLARITALFSRRGFNIDSLAVGVTEHPDIWSAPPPRSTPRPSPPPRSSRSSPAPASAWTTWTSPPPPRPA